MKGNTQDIYDLTPLQEGFLYHSIHDDTSSAYFTQVAYDLTGYVDPDVFQQSLNALFQRHSVLRTAFVYEGLKKPYQVVLSKRAAEFSMEDISQLDAVEQQTRSLEFREQDKERNFNLTKDSLMRVKIFFLGEGRYQLIWSFHHILFDGWSFGKLANEFCRIYDCLEAGKDIDLAPALPYKQFIKWLEGKDKQKAMDYWTRSLADYDKAAGIPEKAGQGMEQAFEQGEVALTFSREKTRRLANIAATNKSTFNTLVQCIWGILLARYNDCSDVIFGKISSMRPPEIKNIDSMVGLFINTLPIRIRFDAQTRFQDLLREAQKANLEAEKFNYCSLAEIQSVTPLKNRLVDHLLVFGNELMVNEQEIEEDVEGTNTWQVAKVNRREEVNYDFSIHVSPGDQAHIIFTFNEYAYEASLINRLSEQFVSLVDQILDDPQGKVEALQIIPKEEQAQLLDWAGQQKAYELAPFHEIFEKWAATTPDQIALVNGNRQVTYRQLNEKATSLAQLLRMTYGVDYQQRIGVFLDRSEWSLTCLLALWKLGAVYVPVDIQYPKERIREVLADSKVSLVLTQASLQDRLPELQIAVLSAEAALLELPEAAGFAQTDVQPTAIAYLIQTSGTSGKPKRVPLRHESITDRIQYHIDFMELSSSDKVLHFAALHFDSSLVEIGMGLLSGGTIVIADQFIKSNTQLLCDTLEEKAVTTAIFTPAFIRLLNKHPLPSIRNIISTGEAAVLEETILYSETKNFYNGYGPSEACIGATFHKVDPQRAEEYKSLGGILIGQPFANTEVYIMDQQQRLLPIGVPGEICVAGVGISKGYLDNPELSAEKFVANPFANAANNQQLYRTGDLARWTEKGELEFMGRIDNQIQIRGIRVEVKEIEYRIEQFEGVKDVRVLAQKQGQKVSNLIAYFISDSQQAIVASDLRAYLSQYLPVYMIPAYFIPVEHFPLTTNGKIDYAALPQVEDIATAAVTDNQVVREPEEEKMLSVWNEVLVREDIELDSNFFDVGGHSLKAITLVLQVQRNFEKKIELQDVFDNPTPALLLAKINSEASDESNRIEKAVKKPYYEASPSQKRTWILAQFEGATTVYNVPGVYMIKGDFKAKLFKKAIFKIVNRHEILRTTFFTEEGVLMQKVRPFSNRYLHIDEFDLTSWPSPEDYLTDMVAEEYRTEFDLENGPLIRVRLAKLDEERTAFILTLHHIIADGWSMQLFFKELLQSYHAYSQNTLPALPELTIQHKDYSEWLHTRLKSEQITNLRTYWHQQFEDDIPILDFPTDLPRPALKTYNGSNHTFEIPKQLTESLKRFNKEQDLTMFTSLLGGAKALIARYTQQTDIVFGTVIAGREQLELQNQIGFYSNTLPLRTQFETTDTITQFLQNVKEVVMGAFKHQSFPFDFLVDELDVKRDVSRSPIFDVLLSHQNVDLFDKEIPELGGVSVEPYSTGPDTSSKFDLEFIFTEFADGITANIVYNTDLFLESTIARLANHFIKVMEAFVQSADTKLNELEMLSQEEQTQLLETFNLTEELPLENTFLDLFAEMVEEIPDAIALSIEDREYTYQQLWDKSDQIATSLIQDYGVEVEQSVAVYMDRSEKWFFTMLGVMKAGAVYVPITPKEPEDRVRYMLDKTDASLVIINEAYLATFDDFIVFDIDAFDWDVEVLALKQAQWPGLDARAYIIFTSGSTGAPKGVMLDHRGMVNHLLAKQEALEIEHDCIIAQTASSGFDISIWQSLTALICGGTTRIYKDDVVMDPIKLATQIDFDEVTIFSLVPSFLATILESLETVGVSVNFRNLQYIVTLGEILPPALVQKWFEHFIFTRFVNHYGPTETCDGVTHFIMTSPPEAGTIPIGKPIKNTRIYILDDHRNPCPIGVKGEMYIAGAAVGQGYINDPELTDAAFLADPFVEGGRMYRSKDIGRWTSDGLLECFGRLDSQVKIRGHRIELGEVEHAFYQLPFVKKVAVIDRTDDKGRKFLCGYYTLKDGMMTTIQDTRKRLTESLPPAMVPEYLFIMDELPVTNNRKIDRKKLPEPEVLDEVREERTLVLPVSETEQMVLDIWKEVLGMDEISTDDNFFEIGGHSFKAIKIQTTLFKRIGLQIGIKDIFTHPDIQSFAAFIDANQTAQSLVDVAG
ncbi:MAG: amino acid adenylation domain-containing protein [Bacteroidota bacterium]